MGLFVPLLPTFILALVGYCYSREPTPCPHFYGIFSIKHSLNCPDLIVLAVSRQDPDYPPGVSAFLMET